MTKRTKAGGRKAGTPNKATALLRQRIDEADPIGFMISIAKGETIDGEQPSLSERARAAEWLGRKIAPDAKERAVSVDLGPISSPSEALEAIAAVIQAMSAGNITPSEATSVCNVINQYLKAYELQEVDERLTVLESRMNGRLAA